MLAFWVSPTIGRAVSRGVLGTKDLEAPKATGLISAKNGVRPVAVGPECMLEMVPRVQVCRIAYQHRFPASFGNTEVP